MVDRKIDIVTIGLLYASLPAVSQVMRITFASLSDVIGRKLFFVINALMNSVMFHLYYFAYTPSAFLLGKITEASKEASIWSVNRPFLLERDVDKTKVLSKLMTVTHLLISAGISAASSLLILLSYSDILVFCFVISIFTIVLPFQLQESREKKRIDGRDVMRLLDPRRRGETFRQFLVFFLLLGTAHGLVGLIIGGHIFTLFLVQGGFEVKAISIILALQMLLVGLSTLGTAIKRIAVKRLLIYGGIPYCVTLFFLGLSSDFLAAFLVVVLGIPVGIISYMTEGILSKTARKESYASDVGLLMTSLHVGRTIGLAFSGFLIASAGFYALFWLSGSIYLILLSLACIQQYFTKGARLFTT